MAGSSVDREIRISASDSGVFDKLSKLKEGALAMGRGIAEETKKQATSSRELIRLMNDEVAVLEKRNRLDKEGRELSAREKFGGKDGNAGALKSELQKISIESKEDKLQADLLKQILQAILKTSKEEVTADRNSVQNKIASDREIDAMDDHEEAIKQTFQKQLLQDTKPQDDETPEQAKKRGMSGLSGVGNFVQNTDMYHMGYSGAEKAGGWMKNKSQGVENKFGKRLLQAGGALFGAAGIAGIGITAATDYYEGRGDITRATGLSNSAATRYSGADANLDMTDAQSLKRQAQLITASGGRIKSKSDLTRMMALERGQGANIDLMADTKSYTTGGDGFNPTGAGIYGSAKYVQSQRGLDHTKTNEIAQLQNELTKRQFMATGEGSLGTNTGVINRMISNQQLAGQRGSVDRARETIGSLDSFVSQGGDDMEAFKFTEFQKARGLEGKSGSYLDYLEEKEKGVTGKVDDYAIKAILGQNLSEDDKAYSLHNMGFKISDARAMIAGGGVEALGVEGVESSANAIGSRDANKTLGSGQQGINDVTQSSAYVTNKFSELGQAAIDVGNKLRAMVGGGDDSPYTPPSNKAAE